MREGKKLRQCLIGIKAVLILCTVAAFVTVSNYINDHTEFRMPKSEISFSDASGQEFALRVPQFEQDMRELHPWVVSVEPDGKVIIVRDKNGDISRRFTTEVLHSLGLSNITIREPPAEETKRVENDATAARALYYFIIALVFIAMNKIISTVFRLIEIRMVYEMLLTHADKEHGGNKMTLHDRLTCYKRYKNFKSLELLERSGVVGFWFSLIAGSMAIYCGFYGLDLGSIGWFFSLIPIGIVMWNKVIVSHSFGNVESTLKRLLGNWWAIDEFITIRDVDELEKLLEKRPRQPEIEGAGSVA